MEAFTPGLNSAIDIIEQGVVLERWYAPVYYLLLPCGYNKQDRSCKRFLKSKITEKYDCPLFSVIVKQNRPIIIVSLASLESQPVSNKTIILKQAAAILKEDANTFVDIRRVLASKH